MHHELEKFLSIVEHGSFTEAARHTHISQPALTSAIQSLEARFDTKLFFRGTKPLRLTGQGEIVYTSASRIRMELNQLAYQLKNIQSGHARSTPIGAIDSIAMRIFQDGIHDDNLEVHVDNSARLIDAVQNSRIDLAFIATPLTQPSGSLQLTDMMLEKFILITHPELARNMHTSISKYRKIDNFITYNPESTTFQRIAAAMKTQKVTYQITFASTSPELIRQAVINKKGAALLPETFVMEYVKTGSLCKLEDITFERPISLVARIDIQFSQTHNNIVEAIRETT